MPGDRFIELATDEDRHVLDVLFSHANEAITVQDRSGRLLYANDTAAEMLGFRNGAELISTSTEEIVDRFEMIGRNGEPLPVEDLPGRKVIAGEPYSEAVVGYRKKGSQRARWSHVRSSPIKNDKREVVLVINFFSDATAQIRRDEDQRLRAAVYEALGSSLDRDEILEAMAEALVPHFGTWCAVHLLEHGGRLVPVASVYQDSAVARTLVKMTMVGSISTDEDRLQSRVARSGKPKIVHRVTREALDDVVADSDAELAEVLRSLDLGSLLCVPMTVGSRLIGTLTVARSAPDPRLEETDLDLLATIADRAAATLENAALYQQQREIAETLQAVLTPRTMPEVPHVQLAARYRPLSLVGHVGGDFYDVIPIPGRRFAVIMGDIAGKGVEAAAAVGLVRYTLRSTIALDPDAETVLARINEALLEEDRMCTLAYLLLDCDGQGIRSRVTLAGHPPPIAITSEGEIRRLGRPCPPAGVLPSLTPFEEEHWLEPGDTLVLYTDGYALSGLDPPESVELALTKCTRDSPDLLVDQMMSMLFGDAPSAHDDVALMVLQVSPETT